jgi:hypothetical protein
MSGLAAALSILLFYAFFYRVLVKRAGTPVRLVVARLKLDSRHPAREVEAVGKLGAAAIAQFAFALLLLALLGIAPGEILGFEPELVVLAVTLGVGEFALAGFLCTVAFRVVASLKGEAVASDWLRQSRGGWMRYFASTRSAAPPWVGWGIIAVYVAVEEVVFRGILVTAAAPYGAAAAISLSTALFVITQVFGMPNLRAALVPVLGAAVVGPVHAVLFWHVHDVLPLVAAHLAFFWGAMRLASGRSVTVHLAHAR